MSNVINLPEPRRWANLRLWSRVAVVKRLHEQRRAGLAELHASLDAAMDLPASDPSKITQLSRAMTLHAQALEAIHELEAAVLEAEAIACAATS